MSMERKASLHLDTECGLQKIRELLQQVIQKRRKKEFRQQLPIRKNIFFNSNNRVIITLCWAYNVLGNIY